MQSGCFKKNICLPYYLSVAAVFYTYPRDYVAVRMSWYTGSDKGHNTNCTHVDYDEIIRKTFLKVITEDFRVTF